jgi:hypothetical protein
MFKKIRSRLTAAISASQEKREYVLEDVFWVPIGNCRSKSSTSRLVPELRPERLDSSEASNSGDVAVIIDRKRLRGHDPFR